MAFNLRGENLKALLVYPEFPDTFWYFRYALKFVSKKSMYPPLGLLTVAGMLPGCWNKRLVDMNVERLTQSQLEWADIVLISAMSVQKDSVDQVIERCKKVGVKIVAGGPLFTAWHEKFEHVDYLVLNEAELTLPIFLEDLQNGEPKHIYTSKEFPDIEDTVQPLWDLIDMKKYASMNIQYSRGCPFDCEFCEIVVLYGHKPRLKGTAQIIAELQSLYDQGWCGGVFFVDDNFIGNCERLKTDVLPAIIAWSEENAYPFSFHTEASINIADDSQLMQLMARAGFDMVFVGIETPNEDSLTECNKYQNKNRDLLKSIDTIQKHGLQVQGGFILGFDNDPASIFDTIVKFIQESRIVVAMVGLLNAPRGTKLFKKLESEHRITADMSGNNTDFSINFTPKMEYAKLVNGYRRVLNTLYSPKNYYDRVGKYLENARSGPRQRHSRIHINEILAVLKSVIKIGVVGKERRWYWKLLLRILFTHPSQLSSAVTFTIIGYHFRKTYQP